MDTRVVEVELPNGHVALIEARDLDGGGATKTGLGRLDFDQVSATLEGVSQAILAAARKASPKKVSVELGIELVVQSGHLVGLVVDGKATTSLKVTLEWEREPATPASPAVAPEQTS